VPTLLIDSLTLTQSVSILEYLDETRPARSLLPTQPAARQQVRATEADRQTDRHSQSHAPS
jgi:maleylacetoacetate isomerase